MANFLPKVILNTSFVKLWLAQITSQFALNALYFVLTLRIYDLTKSNTAVSILILTFSLPSVFLGYLAGVYVDQLSLKKVLVWTNFFRALIILILIFFFHSPIILLVLVFLLALVTLFFIPAEGAAIPSLVEQKELISANSLFSLTIQTGLVGGFIAGGIFLKFFGETGTLLIIFSFFLISFILNLLLPKNIKASSKERVGGMLNNFIKGIFFVFKTKSVRDSIFFLTLTTTIIFVLATIAPGYVDKILKTDIRDASLLVVAPATLGMAFGSFALSHLGSRYKERVLINFGLFGLASTFLILGFLSSLPTKTLIPLLSLGLIFILGLGNALITIPVTTDFQKNTPEEFRGRAYGLLGTFISGIAIIPVLVSGAIGDKFGIGSVLYTLGMLTLIFGVYRLRPKKV